MSFIQIMGIWAMSLVTIALIFVIVFAFAVIKKW